jgi:hypothetical protein
MKTGQVMWKTRHAMLSQPATVILFHSEHLLLLNHTNKFDQYMELNFSIITISVPPKYVPCNSASNSMLKMSENARAFNGSIKRSNSKPRTLRRLPTQRDRYACVIIATFTTPFYLDKPTKPIISCCCSKMYARATSRRHADPIRLAHICNHSTRLSPPLLALVVGHGETSLPKQNFVSHLVYTVRPCDSHIAPVLCHDHAVLKAITHDSELVLKWK